ncbi:hypothetical protein JTB14_032812 [Gonioctena quinquepunctata]|nr:hypothetical protein JTB14_032812 [Gonioctena quinquepunctata]
MENVFQLRAALSMYLQDKKIGISRPILQSSGLLADISEHFDTLKAVHKKEIEITIPDYCRRCKEEPRNGIPRYNEQEHWTGHMNPEKSQSELIPTGEFGSLIL